MTNSTVFARVAPRLANEGWPVFPLVPRSKIPFAGSHGHLDATSDPALVSRWASETPEANVGLRPPEGVLVFDVDAPGQFRRWRTGLGLELPTTREVRTRRGSHLYYRLPDGCPALRAELKDGETRLVDLKRSNGFVLAPGSVAASGKLYRLVRGLPLAALPTLPDSWLPHLARPEPKRRQSVSGQAESSGSGDPTRLARLLGVKRPGQGRRGFLRWALCEAWRTFGDDPPQLERALVALEQTALQVGLDPADVSGLSEWAARQHADVKEPTT